MKSWEHGPGEPGLEHATFAKHLFLYYEPESTGCCSERKANDRLRFARKQTAGMERRELNPWSRRSPHWVGAGLEWEIGMTEKGDAEFYLLGPLPDQACEFAYPDRRRYFLEDGSGRLPFSIGKPRIVALHAKAAVFVESWPLVRAGGPLLSCHIGTTIP